mgnify:CR=1 FL=1
MTALHQYDRLEAVAHVRHGQGANWGEVILQLGTATLVLIDTQGRPLSHWSLATMRHTDTQDGQAIYDLTPDGHDQLRTDDADMIAALAKIENAEAGRTRQPFWQYPGQSGCCDQDRVRPIQNVQGQGAGVDARPYFLGIPHSAHPRW